MDDGFKVLAPCDGMKALKPLKCISIYLLFKYIVGLRVFYRTRVRSLFTLVTNSLTHSLTDSLTAV